MVSLLTDCLARSSSVQRARLSTKRWPHSDYTLVGVRSRSERARAWSGVGMATRSKAASSGAPAGATLLRVRVASSARSVRRLWTGVPSGSCWECALSRAAAERCAGATGSASSGRCSSRKSSGAHPLPDGRRSRHGRKVPRPLPGSVPEHPERMRKVVCPSGGRSASQFRSRLLQAVPSPRRAGRPTDR